MRRSVTLIILLVNCIRFDFAFILRDCEVSPSELKQEPVIISQQFRDFIYPEYKSTVRIKTGQIVLISCPGSAFTLQNKNVSNSEAICISNSDFIINNNITNFKSISCHKKPYHIARFTQNNTCIFGKEIEIGHQISENLFLRQISICFDLDQQITLFAQHNITRFISNREHGIKRPPFIQGNFYSGNISLGRIYSRRVQRKTINQLLGLNENSTRYIKESNYFLSRGHLTPKVDFVFEPQQLSTFFYVNAAPQWQSINGGNWNTIENATRILADKLKSDLIIYTGTYGVATLSNAETGEETQLFLFYKENRGYVPVPEIFWKIVYDPISKRGVTLITVNNPYGNKGIYCNDVSNEIKWIHWKKNARTERKYGYSYACNVAEFRQIVNYLPEFEIKQLLV